MCLSVPELTSTASADKSKNNRNFLDTWGDFHISVHLFLTHILFKYKLHFFGRGMKIFLNHGVGEMASS